MNECLKQEESSKFFRTLVEECKLLEIFRTAWSRRTTEGEKMRVRL